MLIYKTFKQITMNGEKAIIIWCIMFFLISVIWGLITYYFMKDNKNDKKLPEGRWPFD